VSDTNLTNLYATMMQLNRQMMRFAHLGFHGERGPHHGQARLLELISNQNGASQRDLAEEMDVRPSSMTEMLGRLEQAGWIKREQDDQDQRVMRVYLTEAGTQIIEDSSDTRSKSINIIFDCLTEEEKSQLAAINKKLSAHLENLDSSLRDRFREEMQSRHGHNHCCRNPRDGFGRPPFSHGHHCEHSFLHW